MLVLTVPKDLDKLFKNGNLASVAALRILRGVVIVAINIPVMLVVAVLSAKHRRAQAAGEVIDVVFTVKSGDVGPSKCAAAVVTKKTQSSEIISFAKRVLAVPLLVVYGEELGCYNLTAVLETQG